MNVEIHDDEGLLDDNGDVAVDKYMAASQGGKRMSV